uniref:Uncharacterized protein n=1 Tax=Caenorhabditis japonica TaxID=281687 RepID=A0A8R1HPW4_CAEJA
MFATFTYDAKCGESFDTIELKVCNRASASRKVGRVFKMAPKGKFINALTYQYLETPRYGIITSEGFVSADKCNRFGRLFACEESSESCTYYKPAGCIKKTVETDGTFVKEVDDSSFVATHLKKYTIWNQTTTVTKQIGESGQLLLSIPYNYFAIVGAHTIKGRSEIFEEAAVDVEDN